MKKRLSVLGGGAPGLAAVQNMNIPGINMGKIKLSSLTKMTVGLNLASENSQNKASKQAEEKKSLMNEALLILDEVYLQCPSSHSGLVVVYDGVHVAPIMHAGIKITWYRMRGEDSVDTLEEWARAWYAPTIDDVGSMMCVQCEDVYEQGCSRYLECGPIKVDSVVRSAAESAIDYGVFEAKEVCVSLGLTSEEGSANPSYQHDQIVNSNVAPADKDKILKTVLNKNQAFLQLNGRSTIEVDENGIFISIPTFNQTSSTQNRKAGIQHNSQNNGNNKATFNTSRRGLRIPASKDMTVSCAQPTAVVLRLPVARKNVEEAPASPMEGQNPEESLPDESKEKKAADDAEEDEERMRKFLTSSIIAIPWVYEGHNLSPAAYIAENESRLTPEEREKILKEAEEDSIIFANTVVALAEFISSLPDGTNELLLCFACDNRNTRDVLALSMRALACQHAGATRYDRTKVLPWLSDSGEEVEELVSESHQSEATMRRHVKALESENVTLKRERNELMMQLLAVREDIATAKGKPLPPAEQEGAMNSGTSSNGQETTPNITAETEDIAEEGNNSNRQKLLSKIIELENKLSIAQKKEADSLKARDELETRNARLTVDLDRYKKLHEDHASKVHTLQALYDRQYAAMQELEDQQAANAQEIESHRKQLKEMDSLRSAAEQKDAIIAELKHALATTQADVAQFQQGQSALHQQIERLKQDILVASTAHEAAIQHMEQELAKAMMDKQRVERDLVAAQSVISSQQVQIQQLQAMEELLKKSEARADQLAGEINHLQKRSESQSRDLKRILKDNAATISEFEKALVRKSEECNDLYFQILELQNQLSAQNDAQSQSTVSASAQLLSKLVPPNNAAEAGLKSLFRRLSGAEPMAGAEYNPSSSALEGKGGKG